ncbi:MAG TPA: translation initiation factor IF-2 subunit gamma, partial [Nanoarchaeota archaeon]|nr:translation initiation factor IF-2 subunit gamma [Nanoarchaeota archaeon]
MLQALSGKWTDTHSEEIKRGITIKLGYADAPIYKCDQHTYSTKKQCEKCEEQRIVSFVDAPGHETLMATMLSGAAIMDGALLLVAANEECPQPQTKEHLMALQIEDIKNVVIIQNKIDLVTKEDAIKNSEKIREFVKGSIAENAPIIPVSAKYNVNINYIIEAIEDVMKTPNRDNT